LSIRLSAMCPIYKAAFILTTDRGANCSGVVSNARCRGAEMPSHAPSGPAADRRRSASVGIGDQTLMTRCWLVTSRPYDGAKSVEGYYRGVMSPRLAIDSSAVRAFCERHHVARLALFGSVLRDDFDADSDVDVLVEFQPGHVPGLNFVSMERE